MSFSIGSAAIVIYAVVSILTSVLQLAPSYILAAWTSQPFDEQQESSYMVHLFIWSIVVYMILVFIRSFVCQIFMLSSSTNMHNTMAEKVLRADITFFDSNPSGRITTRFSKDMTIIDVPLPPISVLVTQGILRALTVVITVSIVNPWLLIIALIALIYMTKVAKQGIPPMIDS